MKAKRQQEMKSRCATIGKKEMFTWPQLSEMNILLAFVHKSIENNNHRTVV